MYKQVNHIVNGSYTHKEYFKLNKDMWVNVSNEEGESNFINKFIELRYNDNNIVKDGIIIK